MIRSENALTYHNKFSEQIIYKVHSFFPLTSPQVLIEKRGRARALETMEKENEDRNQSKVCSLSEWCFIISIGVSSDHSHLRCMGFAGSH